MGGEPCLPQGQGTRLSSRVVDDASARPSCARAAAVHICLAHLALGHFVQHLNEQEIKPDKVTYYLERRDPQFKQKMAEVLCVYREVKLIKEKAAAAKQS